MNIVITDEMRAKFDEYKVILDKFAKVHSMTRYSGASIDENITDSLDGAAFISAYPKIAIDVGSGAGFPAIFLAMAFKYCKWHLFEPNPKKAAFLTYAKVTLAIANITVHKEKIELAQKFKADLITSRALGSAKFLLQICSGFYGEKTEILLYKGSTQDKEEIKNSQIFERGNRKFLLIKGLTCQN